MKTNRLTDEEIQSFLKTLDTSLERMEFKKECPYLNNGSCGSEMPPSYCDKCYENGEYNIKNGRSFNEYHSPTPVVDPEKNKELYFFNKITEEHNEELAKECKFKKENEPCKYKDFWEKCAYCEKEFSR